MILHIDEKLFEGMEPVYHRMSEQSSVITYAFLIHCSMLKPLANHFGPDQARQNFGPALDQNSLPVLVQLFLSLADDKNNENYPRGKVKHSVLTAIPRRPRKM